MAISVLIVGHANTGKTSLIRTLLKRHDFGQVDNRAGTTRHVESVTLSLNHKPLLNLIDTPGFEDSMGLWENRKAPAYNQLSDLAWLNDFCQSSLAKYEYEQETKILQQLQSCDVILYVIDLRQAPLGKYLDELSLLACASKPIVPVLNFSASPSPHSQTWRSVLAERHLHATIRYDSVAFFFEDEKRLYQSLQSLLPDHYTELEKLIEHRQQAAQQRLDNATWQLSSLLIKAGASRLECAQYPPHEAESNQFEQQLRSYEAHFLAQLITLYEFREDDLVSDPLDIKNGRWQQDIFAPATLKSWGIDTGTSALTGAAIGAGIDVMSAGLTLGTATSVGALLGASWKTGRHYKDTIKSKLTGRYFICSQDATLSLLALRGLSAIAHLHHRGHASQQTYTLESSKLSEGKNLISQLQPIWAKVRQHPELATQDLGKETSELVSIHAILKAQLLKAPQA
ncbi:DUF3482 domain-containing protein [Marinomonas epiphytica]